MTKIHDMIIIGGGPAGYTAALYGARAGLDVLVIEKASVGGQMALTDTVDNYPGFESGVDGFDLAMKMQSGAERFGAKTEYDEVTELELTEAVKKVYTASGLHLSRTLVIATGARPRSLGIDGEDALVGRGIHYCAHCDGRFYKDKTVAVIGGGNTAAADALYLSRLAKKVYLIHRRGELRATKIYHEPIMTAENIKPIWNSTVSGFLTDGGLIGVKVKSLVSGEESELTLDGIFVSIGQVPSSELVTDKLSTDNGYIIADETTRTEIDGVFAVGDVRTKPLYQIVTAVSDGAVAAYYAEKYLAEKAQLKNNEKQRGSFI